MNDIHSRAIDLWIHRKMKHKDANPSDAIIFALTDSSLPTGAPHPRNIVELCEAINQIKGWPTLTEEESSEIQVEGIRLYELQKSGRSPLNLSMTLFWANSLGYLIGFVSLAISGFSWWVLGLIVATWCAFGTARMAAKMEQTESRPTFVLPVWTLIHLACLISLYTVSIIRML